MSKDTLIEALKDSIWEHSKGNRLTNLAGDCLWEIRLPVNITALAEVATSHYQPLLERLKAEAQGHAMEAKTANATLNEIYQLCSGAKGEKANWNGAQPVRELLAEKDAEIARLRRRLDVEESWRKDTAYALAKEMDGIVAENTTLKALLEKKHDAINSFIGAYYHEFPNGNLQIEDDIKELAAINAATGKGE